MKYSNKFIIGTLVGVMVAGLFASVVFGQNLMDRNRQARDKYRAAREQYLKEVNWWKTTRQQFVNARERYRKFRNTQNKADYEKQSRSFLEKTVDVLIRKMESLKTWVSNKPSISESEKQNIVSEINKKINLLNSYKAGLSNATPDQVREKAKEIRSYWKDHRIFVKKVIIQIWIARLNWAIDRFENVSSKVSDKINKLKADGKDTSQLEAWLSDYNQEITAAKEKRDKAQEQYQAISNLDQANQLFGEARQFIKEANGYLRQAHQKLVDIVREMRKMIAPAASTSTPAK